MVNTWHVPDNSPSKINNKKKKKKKTKKKKTTEW